MRPSSACLSIIDSLGSRQRSMVHKFVSKAHWSDIRTDNETVMYLSPHLVQLFHTGIKFALMPVMQKIFQSLSFPLYRFDPTI